MLCECCGTKFAGNRRGRPRKYCAPECGLLSDAISRLEETLPGVCARLMAGSQDDRQNLVELRYRLFTLLADEVPRPRTSRGTFMPRRLGA